jgi:hypothetical protein
MGNSFLFSLVGFGVAIGLSLLGLFLIIKIVEKEEATR